MEVTAMKDHRISLRVESGGRRYSLLPVSVEMDFGKLLKGVEKEQFYPTAIKMFDKATGRNVPCQFSSYSDKNHLKGALSWILLNEAQKEFEIEIIRENSHPFCSEGKIKNSGDKQLEIYFNGEHITNYIFNEAYERPFLYPVIGPDGLCVTRHIPNFGDHPHHKGIGLNLGDVSGEKGKPGINFWGMGRIGDPTQGRVIHQRFICLEQGDVFIKIEEENIWKQNDELEGITPGESLSDKSRWKIKKKGKVLMNEIRTITIWNVLPNRIIDIHTVMAPITDEVILGADVEGKEMRKENGPLLIRVTDNMRGSVEGTIVNSEGARTEKQCWGRPAKWVDYYGPVIPGGPVNGIAVMDHPNNLRHSPGWHVRDYGLFSPNIFYDKNPEWPDQGPIYLSRAKGEKLDLHYRIYIHHGDEKDGEVEQKWQNWVNPPRVTYRTSSKAS